MLVATLLCVFIIAIIITILLSGIIADIGYIEYIKWNGQKNAFGLFLFVYSILVLYVYKIQWR